MEPINQGATGKEVAKLSHVIQIDEGKIQEQVGKAVRSTAEATLNAMPDAEADRLCMHFPGSFGGGRPFIGDSIGRRLNQKK